MSEKLKQNSVKTNLTIMFSVWAIGLSTIRNVISEKEWKALEVTKLPQLSGPLFVGIKYGNDGTNVLSIAVKTADDRIFVETIDCQSVRNGNQWIINFLMVADSLAVRAH